MIVPNSFSRIQRADFANAAAKCDQERTFTPCSASRAM